MKPPLSKSFYDCFSVVNYFTYTLYDFHLISLILSTGIAVEFGLIRGVLKNYLAKTPKRQTIQPMTFITEWFILSIALLTYSSRDMSLLITANKVRINLYQTGQNVDWRVCIQKSCIRMKLRGCRQKKKIGVHVFGIPPLLAKLSRTILI